MFSPTESTEHKGWYLIPGESRYLASPGGYLLNRKTMKVIYGTVAPNGYRVFNLYSKQHKRDFTTYLHRVICTAFNGPSPEGAHVNHKDGDKLNNNKSNLEWCTPLENIRHACRLGLMDSNVPVHVWDVLLDRTSTYRSITDVKTAIPTLKVCLGNVPKGLTRELPLFKGRYYIRPTYLDEPWPSLESLRRNFMIALSPTTGKRYLVTNQSLLGSIAGVGSSTIGMALTKKPWALLKTGLVVSRYESAIPSIDDTTSTLPKLLKEMRNRIVNKTSTTLESQVGVIKDETLFILNNPEEASYLLKVPLEYIADHLTGLGTYDLSPYVLWYPEVGLCTSDNACEWC